MEVHLPDNSSIISHQTVHLLLYFADNAKYDVEFWVVCALNHTIFLGMPFLQILSPSINWETHTSKW